MGEAALRRLAGEPPVCRSMMPLALKRSLLPPIALAACLLLVGGGSLSAAPSQPRRLNIVVIETDDQTVAAVQVMPIVRRLLVAQGTTFLNSFVANSLCCPSRATFLTGQYSHNNGVWDNGGSTGGWAALRPTQANTLPVWLQQAGYATIFIGKWLNGYGYDQPAEVPAGWKEWFGAVAGSWNDYYDVLLNENGQLTQYKGTYTTDLYTEKAEAMIERYASSPRPFFLWLCYIAPHTGTPREQNDPPGFDTAVPAPEDLDRFATLPLPEPPSYNEADVSDKPRDIQRLPQIDADTAGAMREAYEQQLESLQAVDRGVARILRALTKSKALAHTLVVFTSDNGYLNGEHRVVMDKAYPYEPSIRVPLIVRGPGVARHRVSRALVSNVDLAPTFVDLARARAGRLLDGRSLRPLFSDPDRAWRSELLIESPLLEGDDRIYTAVRTGRYSWIEYADGDRELYDLARDPYELTSVHARPKYASVRANLKSKLAQLRACRGATCQR
jgi:N-acetylglucosamine-6-sulfatase